MSDEKVIRIDKNGNIMCVYNDDLPFLRNGRAKLTRASNVFWNEAEQRWKVVFNTHGGWEAETRFFRRKDAIEFEVTVLNQVLEDGYDPAEMFNEIAA